MRNFTMRAALLGATAALALQAGGAMAQAEQDYAGGHKPVLEDYTDELGARMGGFILRPQATVSAEYNDNIYYSDGGEEEDLLLRVAPEVELASDWNRHALRFNAGVGYGAYVDNEADNFLDAFGQVQGVYDISRISAVRATLRADRLHEGRGDVDADNAALEPVEYTVLSGRIDGRYKPNRIRISPFVEVSHRNYDDASIVTGIQNNDDRDRIRVGGGVEVGYEFLDGYEAFVRGQADQVTYDDSVDDQGVERDSVGLAGLAGVRFDLTRIITADLGIGIVSRDYEDPTLETLTGVTAEATATWSVTPLTTLVFSLERDIEETTQNGASGAFATKGEIEVVHSLRRDVLVSAFINAVDRDFEGGARQDRSVGVGVGAEWAMNRNLTLAGRYEHGDRDSTRIGEDYKQNLFTIALTTKY